VFKFVKDVDIPAELAPQLVVVIDTEEEFNWNDPVERSKTSVAHMEMLDRCQDIFNEYKVKPCYVIGYPVASQADGCRLLKSFHQQGLCEIGAHLHPWVTPPFSEELSTFNTYPGNLPEPLEFEKLKNLKALIDSEFQQETIIYKAGRYGFGPNTEKILQQLGFQIDISVCPPVDYRGDGGPDYRAYSHTPFWFGEQQLLELPVTGAYVGLAGNNSQGLYEWSQHYKSLKMPAILSRLGVVDRLMLSPEGYTSAEHKLITKSLLKQGVRVFTWSFHSPSIEVGHTPYVRTEQELRIFLDKFRRFFDFFFHELGGQPSSPQMLLDRFKHGK